MYIKSMLKVMIFATIVSGSIISSPLVMSADTPTQLYKKNSTYIVQNLLDHGIQTLGELNLQALKNDISSVDWNANKSGGFLAGSGRTRVGAIYDIDKRAVYVNENTSLKGFEGALPLQALHEALGALGYIDENYEVSLTLELILLSKKHSQFNIEQSTLESLVSSHLQSLSRRSHNQEYSSGGSTSIGGGGDGILAKMKMLSLIAAPNWLSYQKSAANCSQVTQTKFLNFIISTPFEYYQQFDSYTGSNLPVLKAHEETGAIEVQLPYLHLTFINIYNHTDLITNHIVQSLKLICRHLEGPYEAR